MKSGAAIAARDGRLRPRSLLRPLVPVYAAAVGAKNAAYDLRLLQPRRLSWPVVAIGNLSVGGAGKTPMAILLARLLAARGWRVDVLSRGYGRKNRAAMKVDPEAAAREDAAAEFGDEPVLMARQGISVFVGADRHRAGMLAEEPGFAENGSRSKEAVPPGVHLLDDGFQHRKLARDVDIVLVRRSDLQGELLPAGNLREPPGSLRRADIVVLRAQDSDLGDRVLGLMGQSDPARVWIVERRMVLPSGFEPTGPAVAFCAIGDPGGFFEGLRQAGVRLAGSIAFCDHRRFTQADIERIGKAGDRSGASCWITTEKDAVRLPGRLRAALERDRPLWTAGLEVRLRDETHALAALEALLRA